MIKHRYDVSGVNQQGENFVSECIDTDIIKAIEQYRAIHYSVHKIKRYEQVEANSEIKIIGIW